MGQLATLVRRYRIAAGLSQEALAERAGISVRGLSDLERGLSRTARLHTLARLADALGLAGAARAELLDTSQPSAPSAAGRTPAAGAAGLPIALTSFVGRRTELAEAQRLLGGTRLLSLVGPGGMGKTRLALALAAAVAPDYSDGVVLVDLVPLADPRLLVPTVAAALGLRERPGQSLRQALVELLRARHLLLVLDNCEHLAQACAELVAELLRGCPSVRILATSREPVGVPGETLWRVPGLGLPDLDRLPAVAALGQVEAVHLFLDRARAVRPTFALNDQNTRSVAELCVRLDGIPLAIELAAARVGALSVQQLASRLDDRLRLLASGSRTTPVRHQTLWATVDWSYELLGEDERTLFARLAVFAGGWTLEAAEAVCAGDGLPSEAVLDVLARLVDRSLVMAEPTLDGSMRYRLLETLRQYAHERLVEQPGIDTLRRRHAGYYAALAERAEEALVGPDQVVWFANLEAEIDNFRAVLRWSTGPSGDPELGLRLAAVYRFWNRHGHVSEARAALDRLLPRVPGPATLRARGLMAACTGAMVQFDHGPAEALHAELLALAEATHDGRALACAYQGLGYIALGKGDATTGELLLRRGLAAAEAAHEPVAAYTLQIWLGNLAVAQDAYEQAERWSESALVATRSHGDLWGLGMVLGLLGQVALGRGEPARAAGLFWESLLISRELGDGASIARYLDGLAQVEAVAGDAARAARLFGAAAAHHQLSGAVGLVPWVAKRERAMADARAALGDAAFQAAWIAGRDLGLEAALAEAELVVSAEQGQLAIGSASPARRTARPR
ncbi:MAG: XRE family transcriptional regulator [Chloroflexi bacterium]|nr:XRE family transcriptional regulator [Chloroflexota bacterium]